LSVLDEQVRTIEWILVEGSSSR